MQRFKCVIVVLITVATLSAARSTATDGTSNAILQPEVQQGRSDSTSTTLLNDFRFLHKIYQDCSSGDLSTCLKLKLVTAMDRASRAYPVVQFIDGVTFVKDKIDENEHSFKSEADIEAGLPRALNDREDALNTLIVDKIFEFFQSHTLQIKLPTSEDLQRSFAGEERGKRKKMSGLLLIPLLLGGSLIPLALGGLALLAGKALIISKLALVLALIIGLKKLFSGGHGGHGHEEVVVASPGHGGGSGWGRAYEKQEHAQNLAYSAYAAKPSR